MAVLEFDVNAFWAAFPAFQQTPIVELQSYWDSATLFVSDQTWCPTSPLRPRYINLMTAHLAALACLIAAGDSGGIVTGATIDKISVTLQPPPEVDQFQWWLNQTPYGQQLLALLQVQSVAGFYVGGGPELSSFRKGYGRFY